MRCRLDGSQVRTVLGGRRQRSSRSADVSSQRSSSCSCPVGLSVAPSFAIDYSDQPASQHQQLLYVADSDSGDIWATDSTGCRCRLVVNATTLSLTFSDIGEFTVRLI